MSNIDGNVGYKINFIDKLNTPFSRVLLTIVELCWNRTTPTIFLGDRPKFVDSFARHREFLDRKTLGIQDLCILLIIERTYNKERCYMTQNYSQISILLIEQVFESSEVFSE